MWSAANAAVIVAVAAGLVAGQDVEEDLAAAELGMSILEVDNM
jgi:hypothetical protein